MTPTTPAGALVPPEKHVSVQLTVADTLAAGGFKTCWRPSGGNGFTRFGQLFNVVRNTDGTAAGTGTGTSTGTGTGGTNTGTGGTATNQVVTPNMLQPSATAVNLIVRLSGIAVAAASESFVASVVGADTTCSATSHTAVTVGTVVIPTDSADFITVPLTAAYRGSFVPRLVLPAAVRTTDRAA